MEGEIDQAWFRGSPLLDEILFFHKASRTAIFADPYRPSATSFCEPGGDHGKERWRGTSKA